MDREGVTVPDAETIEHEIEYEDFGCSSHDAVTEVGVRLSRLTGESVEDEEGIFDLAVYRAGELVAALVVSTEDSQLELSGERVPAVKDLELGDALTGALASDTAIRSKH